jgi:hypothetical protein
MKTIGEIVEMCKSGEIPTVDEMRFTICAMDSLSVFDNRGLLELVRAKIDKKSPTFIDDPEFQWSESHRRWQSALGNNPKDYLGENNNPDNPVVQESRKLSKKIMGKFIGGK